MSQKSANVVARIEPSVKEQAEAILDEMGISASLAINIFYHQIIKARGLPFTPTARTIRPKSLEELSAEEFDERMTVGLAEAKADKGSPLEDVVDRLRAKSRNEQKAI